MGTDIHLHAEIRTEDSWNLIGEMEKNVEFFPDENAPEFKPTDLYRVRDYNLFDILGGLQRSTLRTLNGQEFETIAPRRGLPADLCPQIRQWHEQWNDDEYGSFGESWLLLSEILAFDWEGKKMRFEATVDARVAHLFRENQPFPKAHWPPDIPVGYGAYLRDGVKVRWTNSYAASVDPNFFQMLKSLKSLGKPSYIRLIFWFDS